MKDHSACKEVGGKTWNKRIPLCKSLGKVFIRIAHTPNENGLIDLESVLEDQDGNRLEGYKIFCYPVCQLELVESAEYSLIGRSTALECGEEERAGRAACIAG